MNESKEYIELLHERFYGIFTMGLIPIFNKQLTGRLGFQIRDQLYWILEDRLEDGICWNVDDAADVTCRQK